MKRKHKGRADIWIRVIALIAILATIGAVAYVQFSGTGSKVEQAISQVEIATPNSDANEKEPVSDTVSSETNTGDFFPIIDEGEPVDADYFDDAVFIGDSIVNGLKLNSAIARSSTWLVNDNMTVASAETDAIELADGTTTKLMDALEAEQYKKVYIMLGVNDLTAPADEWAQQYGELLADIAEKQPDAIIYVMGVMPVSRIAAQGKDHLSPISITNHNQALFKVLWNNGYYYLDTYGQFADGEGYLASEDNTDGIHLTASKYLEMYQYICGRTVEN